MLQDNLPLLVDSSPSRFALESASQGNSFFYFLHILYVFVFKEEEEFCRILSKTFLVKVS